MKRRLATIAVLALCIQVVIGAMAFPVHAAVIGSWAYKSWGLEHIVIGEDVTEIGVGAFANNRLRTVTIPANVRTIRDWAFEHNQLSIVMMEGSDTAIGNWAFANNPNGLTIYGPKDSTAEAHAVGRYDFVEAYGLFQEGDYVYTVLGTGGVSVLEYVGTSTEAIIPDQLGGIPVTEIGKGAFQNKGITSVTLPDSLEAIGVLAFASNTLTSVTIPDSVTKLGDWAFERNHLTHLDIGLGVTTIGNGVFSRNHFAIVNIPETVVEIGEWAFERNPIIDLRLPSQLRTIGKGAFLNSLIKKVRIPASVEIIREYAFFHSLLRTVIMDGNPISIEDKSFGGEYTNIAEFIFTGVGSTTAQAYALSNGYHYYELRKNGDYHYVVDEHDEVMIVDYLGSGGSVTLPAQLDGYTVTSVGAAAFSLHPLTAVVIPDTITTIRQSAFQYNSLSQLHLGRSVVKIDEMAFLSNKIKQVRLPESVELVDKWAFLYNPVHHFVVENATTELHENMLIGSGGSGAGTTIVGYEDSTAEQLATHYTLPFVHITTAPLVHLWDDGQYDWHTSTARTIAVQVEHSLDTFYQWSTADDVPLWADGEQWAPYQAGEDIPLPTESGIWTLYIRTVDYKNADHFTASSSFHIDNDPPHISLRHTPTRPTRASVKVLVDISDKESGIVLQKWAAGIQDESFFVLDGTLFRDSFTVAENGSYTIFAEDGVGNTSLRTITITNIDKTLPRYDNSEAIHAEEKLATDPKASISKEGGSFEQLDVIVTIPASAVLETIQLSIDVVSHIDALPDTHQLRSLIYEITKDKEGEFQQRVRVSLPFTSTPSELAANGQRLSLFWLNEATQEWVELDDVVVDWDVKRIYGSVDHFTKFAALAVDGASSMTTEVEPIELTDIAGHWGEASITQLVNMGVVTGYPDRSYRPEQMISRAEFVALVIRALSMELVVQSTPIDAIHHWANRYVATAYAHGIVMGYPDGYFHPDAFITREEMALILTRSFQLEERKTNERFIDNGVASAWAKKAIDTAIAHGIIAGTGAGYIMPKAHGTRAEAASMIVRAITKGANIHE